MVSVLAPFTEIDAADFRRVTEVTYLGYVYGTMAALSHKLASGLLDRYLARTGYDSQQSERPMEPDRRNNLWEPVATELTVHGDNCHLALATPCKGVGATWTSLLFRSRSPNLCSAGTSAVVFVVHTPAPMAFCSEGLVRAAAPSG
jgi:hypothetical protein